MRETTTVNQNPSTLRQALVLLAGPVAWSLQLTLGYTLIEAACSFGFLGFLGGRGWYLLVFGMTLLAALVTGWAGIASYRQWQSMRRGSDGDGEDSHQYFMVLLATMVNAAFVPLIVLTGIPALFLGLCTNIP